MVRRITKCNNERRRRQEKKGKERKERSYIKI